MEESKLQREFKDRDVQRMRNIIKKDYTAKTTTQVGYNKVYVDREEGDVWEEDGKKWTLKNGIKQTITKFDRLKQLVAFPLSCPHCDEPMKSTPVNKKMWVIHKMCRDCVIEMEAKIRLEGKWDEYEKGIMNANKNDDVNDFESAFNEYINTKAESYITEQGDIETWSGGKINEEEIKHVKEYIKKMRETEI
jgi:hypothetical protein